MSASRPPLDGRPCQDGGMRCWTCGQDDCGHDEFGAPPLAPALIAGEPA